MSTRERQIIKKQVIIDSRQKTSGNHNDYVIDLKGINTSGNTYTNVFLSNFKNVVGLKVIGVFIKNTVSQISNIDFAPTAIDFVCPEIPNQAQQLSSTHGYVLCRVPLLRRFPGGTSAQERDQWWEAPAKDIEYFSPVNLQRLHISLYTNLTNGSGPGGSSLYDTWDNNFHPNYLIMEVYTLDTL